MVRSCVQALNRQQSKDGLLGGPLGGVGKADVQLAGLLETTAAPSSAQVAMSSFRPLANRVLMMMQQQYTLSYAVLDHCSGW